MLRKVEFYARNVGKDGPRTYTSLHKIDHKDGLPRIFAKGIFA